MPQPNANNVTGEEGKITIEGVDLHVRDWSIEETVGFDDDTDTSAGGWRTSKATIKSLEGSCTVNLDTTDLPAGQTTPLVVGAEIDAFVLYIGAVASAATYTFKAQISSISFQSAVGSVITFTMGFRANGSVTRPT